MPLVRDASGRLVHRAFGDPAPDKTASPTVGATPVDATYVTLTANATLTQERTLAVGTGLSLTDAGAGSTITIAPDLDLAALEALGSTGIAARTAANTWAQRTLQAPAAGLTITNPAGVAGDPTFAFANDLSALEGLGATGIAVRTAADTWAQRTIVDAGSGRIGVTNPGGVAGNITLDVNGAALTKVDDTNVTLTLGGSASTALVNAASLTLGWTGTLAAGRLNSNVVQGVTNDTNVTGSIAAQNLTLGWTGTLAAGRLNSNVVQSVVNDTNVTGSIAAQALTLGWTGTLDVTRGGTGRATSTTAYGLLAAGTTATGAHQTLAAGATTEILVGGGASALPVWTTATGSGAPVRATSPTIATPTITTHATCPLVYGGPSTSDNLDLYANDEALAQANTGRVRFRERAEWPDNWTWTSANQFRFLSVTGTMSGTGISGIAPVGFYFEPTISYDTAQSLSLAPAFFASPTFSPTATVTDIVCAFAGFWAQPRYRPNAAAITPVTPLVAGFLARPGGNIASGTSGTITDLVGYVTNYVQDTTNGYGYVGSGITATSARHYWVRPWGKHASGTITTQVGLDIDNLTTATTNVGVRSAVSQASARWGLQFTGDADNASLGGLALGSSSTAPDTILHIRANSASTARRGAITFEEDSSNPSNPTSGSQMRVYMKADKFVIQYNHGGTIRYYTLDLTSAAGTWAHSTVAP